MKWDPWDMYIASAYLFFVQFCYYFDFLNVVSSGWEVKLTDSSMLQILLLHFKMVSVQQLLVDL